MLRPVLFDREAVVDGVEVERAIEGIEVVLTLIGGLFAACGLIEWQRRPDSYSGLLMLATAVSFLAPPVLGQIDDPFASTVRLLLLDAWFFLQVALVLVLVQSGRLRTRFDRLLTASFAIPMLFGQVARTMTDPEQGRSRTVQELDEGHLLLAWPDADVAQAIDTGQRVLLVVGCVVTVVVVVTRWWAASRPRRRALSSEPRGRLQLVWVAALLFVDVVTGPRLSWLAWLAACSLVSVPVAFLAGLLRSRLARGGLADLVRGLGSLHGPDLEPALRRALRDPGLELVVGGAASAGPGRAVAHVEQRPPRRRLGDDESLDEDPELLEAACAATAVALENQQLLARRRAGSRSSERRANGSWPPATPSGDGSSGTCTTARNSVSSRSRCS